RKALPKNHEPPEEPSSDPSNEVKEAIRYIQKNFPENPGNAEHFWFGTTEKDAWLWFDQFLNQRFKLFGDYEDAVSDDHTVLYHSVLTPYLNAGIISPEAVVERTIEFAEANKIPMNCLEGFIRQIIGWREFMRAMYEQHGVEERTKNYWNFDRPMPTAFYTASTGIDPIDTIIRRVLDRCYCHHIERLMIIGNFMLLCRIRPDDIYRWFMELYIDAYDWVMVPNVYGMSQFADGGIFTTKPYISSSNYVRKMSTFKKGPWCDVWDGLFWSFIKDQEAFFRKHPRLGMMTRQLDKMDPAKLKLHQKNAARFLKQLDAG
ncbi:MAG: cryptochrome/photolyase family protein, partial [Verrucomicrobiota bacterium]